MVKKNFIVESLEARQLLSFGLPVIPLPLPIGDLIIPDVEDCRLRGGTVTRQGPVNGDFAAFPDLTGWQQTGNDFVVAGDFKPVPDGGSAQAVVSNAQAPTAGVLPVSASSVESFLGLKSGALSKQGKTAVNGSAIKQDITGKAGDTITFKVDFLTNEAAVGGNGDFGFITVGFNGQSRAYKITGKLVATDPLDSNGFASETGYKKYTIVLPCSGKYSIGFGVVNVGNALNASDVLVSNVKLNTSPIGNIFGLCDGRGDQNDDRGGWNFGGGKDIWR